jgi:hypothetical protein
VPPKQPIARLKFFNENMRPNRRVGFYVRRLTEGGGNAEAI